MAYSYHGFVNPNLNINIISFIYSFKVYLKNDSKDLNLFKKAMTVIHNKINPKTSNAAS